jgi:hypothetical protein
MSHQYALGIVDLAQTFMVQKGRDSSKFAPESEATPARWYKAGQGGGLRKTGDRSQRSEVWPLGRPAQRAKRLQTCLCRHLTVYFRQLFYTLKIIRLSALRGRKNVE